MPALKFLALELPELAVAELITLAVDVVKAWACSEEDLECDLVQ